MSTIRFARAAPGRFRLMFGPRRVTRGDDLTAAMARAFAILRAGVEQVMSPGEDARALAVGYWSFAHGLAVLLIDGRINEELSSDGDASTRRT